jgi:hypothetical protein
MILEPSDTPSATETSFPSRNGPYRLEQPSALRLSNEFRQLVQQWKADVAHLSSTTERTLHPAYLRIIGLGPPAVPLLLAELAREPNHWFSALQAITAANPVPPEDRGRVRKTAEDWLRWGEQNGFASAATPRWRGPKGGPSEWSLTRTKHAD